MYTFIMLKMTMLPVLNYHAILLKSGRYIWHVFMQIWYLDKDWNIFIFEVELVIFVNLREKIEKCFNHFIRKLSNVFYGVSVMPGMFSSQST